MSRTPRPVHTLPFDQAVAHIDALTALLKPFHTSMSAKDRNRRLKMPSKSADAIPHIIALGKEWGLGERTLVIEQHAAALDGLIKVTHAFTMARTILEDIVLGSESATWSETTTLYSMLRRLSKGNANLDKGMQPVAKKYFAKRKDQGTAEAGATGEAAPAALKAPASPKKKRRSRR